MIKKVSIVIPVYNEEASIPFLVEELFRSIGGAEHKSKYHFELIFVDDGSADNSLDVLRKIKDKSAIDKNLEMVIVTLDGNFGQHQAIMAGFSVANGDYMITLDADLQNPPEEILRICAEMDRGFDYVGTIREDRQDKIWRRWLSKINNMIRERITNIKITDQGCMLRGYNKRIVHLMLKTHEWSLYIPALAYSFSQKPTEIRVSHSARNFGESKYSFYKLMRLNFDIMTVYSLIPLQIFSLLGMAIAVVSGGFFFILILRRLIIGPEAEGLFTLFALLFFFMGICLFGLGMLGEYVGRIYSEVRMRPRYLIRHIWRDEA
jgi:undecaprenyl-phosphate 4-deoxy-4-formamido-L-arabinose transferase